MARRDLMLPPRDRLLAELGARNSLAGAAALAGQLLDKLHNMQFHTYEPLPADTAVVALARGPIAEMVALLNSAVRLLRSLPVLLEQDAKQGSDAEEPSGFEQELTNTKWRMAPVDGTPTPPLDKFCEDLDALCLSLPQLTDRQVFVEAFLGICGRTVQALKESMELIRQARREQSKWGLITAGEEARRKTQKSLRAATLLAAFLLEPQTAPRYAMPELSELQTALRVRTTLLGFQRAVLPLCHPMPPPGAWPDVLRQVKAQMTQLLTDAHYYQIRAPDRYALQNIDSRLSLALDSPNTAVPEGETAAQAALTALYQFAQKLQGINQRPLLVEHDRQLCHKLLQALTPSLLPQPSPIPAAQLAALWQDAAPLRWRSSSLATLLGQPVPLPAARLAAELSRLQGELGKPAAG